MRTINLLFSVLLLTTLVSCGGAGTNGSEGFTTVESDLRDQFGDQAYYIELTITHNDAIGNIISTTVTKDPESLMMGQWTQTQGNWQQTAEVSIEIPEESKASDFMFQLGETVSLKKLSELVEQSKKNLTAEKDLSNPRLHMAMVKYPDTGEEKKAEYIVMLQPETGGTTFTYSYQLNGELIGMDY